jgi:hypothetical protein
MAHPLISTLMIGEAADLTNTDTALIHKRAEAGEYGEITHNRNCRLISIAALERINGREFSDGAIEAVLANTPARRAMLRDLGFPLLPNHLDRLRTVVREALANDRDSSAMDVILQEARLACTPPNMRGQP